MKKIGDFCGGLSVIGAFIAALLSIWIPGFPVLKTFGTLIVLFLFAALVTWNPKKK